MAKQTVDNILESNIKNVEMFSPELFDTTGLVFPEWVNKPFQAGTVPYYFQMALATRSLKAFFPKFDTFLVHEKFCIVRYNKNMVESVGRDVDLVPTLIDTSIRSSQNNLSQIDTHTICFFKANCLIFFNESQNFMTICCQNVEMLSYYTQGVYAFACKRTNPPAPPPVVKRSISIITHGYDGLELTECSADSFTHDISEEDLALHYNEDFSPFFTNLKSFLTDDKQGLALFHGVPGSGKTSLVKWILGLEKLSRTVVYFPSNLLDNFGAPTTFEFFRENPGSIYLMEDAEVVLKKRSDKSNNNSAVANLLNATDGIIGGLINSKFICTFNSPMEELDEALLRPGRLKVKYEFTPLSVDRSQILLNKLGKKFKVEKPMTLAEIYNIA